jgi:hypothetical protein
MFGKSPGVRQDANKKNPRPPKALRGRGFLSDPTKLIEVFPATLTTEINSLTVFHGNRPVARKR